MIVDNTGETLRVTVMMSDEIFLLNMKLTSRVNLTNVIRIGASSGKIELDLTKSTPGRWKSLGTPLDKHLWFGLLKVCLNMSIEFGFLLIRDVQDVEETYRDWRVVRVREDTHNTRHLILSPPPGLQLSPGVGQHVNFRTVINNPDKAWTVVEGLEVTRSYTPVVPLLKQMMDEEVEGCLQFLIKVYPHGMMTPGLGELLVGDTVSVSHHTGSFRLSQVPLSPASELYLLTAGTGITPIIGLLAHLQKLSSKPAVKLITFDRKEEDIIWRAEIGQFEVKNSDWLTVVRVLSEAGASWSGERGRVRPDLLTKHLRPGGSRWAAVCGPPGFNRETVRLLREHLGFSEEEIHLFEG